MGGFRLVTKGGKEGQPLMQDRQVSFLAKVYWGEGRWGRATAEA